MQSNEQKVSAKHASEMKFDIKNECNKPESLDATLDLRMMKAESHRLEKLFHEIDTNRDGKIDAHELSEGLKRMGYCHISEEQVEEFLRKSDVSLSGDLDMSEFINYLQQHENQLRIVFSTLDQNKDGKICIDEVTAGFKKMGIMITENEAAALLHRINEDNSLDISFEEWRDYLLFHPSTDLVDIINHWRNHTIIDIGEDIAVPDDFSEQDMISGMWWRHLVAGGVAGAVSRTCTAPLDRLKIFLQVHGGRKKLQMLTTMKMLLKEGGVRGLWRGNGINVLKIAPESAIKFGAYDFLKRMVRGEADRELQLYERFLCGSLAGGISQTVIYPLEVLKTRLALRRTGEYNGVFDCAKQLYRREGFRVFYRGYIPNLLGILPYAGIDLAVYETLKRRYLQHNSSEGSSPPALSLLTFGTFSSCCGQVAAYPLALVRTKLQSQAGLNLNLPVEQTQAIGLFRYTVRTEGIKGLYRGIVPNFFKVAPAVSISYFVYERTREYLGVEMT